MSASTTAGIMRQSKAIDLNDDDPNNLNRYKLRLSLFCPNSRHPEGVKSQNLPPHTHSYDQDKFRPSGNNQTTAGLSLTLWLIFLFVPHFFLPSSCYLLYSPKADTVTRQPAQHNSPALHSVGPCGFNQTVWVCAHLYTEHTWGKVKAMNSFRLISKRQKSLQLPRAASWLEC